MESMRKKPASGVQGKLLPALSANALDLGVPTTPCEVGTGVLLQKKGRKKKTPHVHKSF